MEASSTVVIKVKYGDMLRRFSALIVDGELGLNMNGLRKKILSLFSFAPDTDLMLTYIDEDGDVVTLVDDDDLHDVVKQALNPLRITVNLNAEKNDRQDDYPSSKKSTQEPSQNLSTGVSEILQAVPEPLREALVNLSTDLASKGLSFSAPGITELVDHLSNVGLSYLGPLSESQARSAATGTKISELSAIDAATLKVPSMARHEDLSLKNNESIEKLEPEATMENNEVISCNVIGGSVEGSSSRSFNSENSAPVHTKPGVISHSVGKKEKFKKEKIKKEKVKKIIECYLKRKSHLTPPVSHNEWLGRRFGEYNVAAEKEVSNHSDPKPGPNPANASAPAPVKADCLDGITNSVLPGGSGKSQGSLLVPNPHFPGLDSGISVDNTSVAPTRPASEAVPFRRNFSQNDGSGNIFHRGVRCDGCGVHPITGPRFKSKVKVDYDLCSICFEQMGNYSDYIRMDRPAVYRHMSFKDAHARDRGLMLPQVYRDFKVKPYELDSRFIQDVNIIDGTLIAPLTPFTKIWRMRNNGTVVWPQKTQLVWIGGDKLSNAISVKVEIPTTGLMIDQELDVAVDFITPEFPGRYVSYWRMASPSGQKFGQRVWVLIQVDASVKKTPLESDSGINLNLPPIMGPEVINVNPEPIVEGSHQSEADNSKKVELVKPIVDSQPSTEQELKFPINDSLLVGNGASSSSHPCASPSVSYPIINLSDVEPLLFSVPLAPFPSAHEYEASEEKLLKELEEMGFKQVDLNKDILRMNEYDLERSVEDLCCVSEWDPILDELHEMGFHDREMNKMLLKKNDGSIKRVVMDLIGGENIW